MDKNKASFLLEQAGLRDKSTIAYSNSFQERPSRVIIATDAIGPQVPAWYGLGASLSIAHASIMESIFIHLCRQRFQQRL